MLEISIKRIKFFFLALVAILIISLTAGVIHLDGSYYWQGKYLAMQWIFLSTRVEYLSESHLGLYKNEGLSMEKLTEAETAGSARAIPVLLYHGVIEDPAWVPDDVNIRFSDFKKDMILLKSLGYETVSIDDFLAYTRGEKALPAKSFLLTFDDGRKDSYYPVDPILKALGYRATMFVISGRSLDQSKEENTFHLNEIELQKMVNSGRWDIESHGKDDHDLEKIDAQGDQGHFLSNKIWLKYEGRIENDEEFKKRIEDDLSQSKKDIEEKLGVKVQAFAYPFGDYGTSSVNYPESKNIILSMTENIFPYSFYQVRNSDFIGNYPENSHLLKRFPVTSEIKPVDLANVLINSLDKQNITYEDKFTSDKGWIEGWGSRQFQDGLMLTGPTNSEDSSLTFLDGTYLWKDYTFKGKVKLVKGKSFAFLARYKDGDDYISCDYGAEEISINIHQNGEETRLTDVPISSQIFTNEIEAGISVKDQNVSCLLNNSPVVSAQLSQNFSNGGIGLKTWDNELHNSEIIVKDVIVQDIVAVNAGSFRGIISKVP